MRFTDFFLFSKICWKSFCSSLLDLASTYITSSRVTAETSLILVKYFLFSQILVGRFQTQLFSHIWHYLHSHRHLSLFHHWSELHFFHQIYICICMIYAFLIFFCSFTSVLFGTHTLLDNHFEYYNLQDIYPIQLKMEGSLILDCIH